jgi:hypothetical protein
MRLTRSKLVCALLAGAAFAAAPALTMANPIEINLDNPQAEFVSINGGTGQAGEGTNHITWGTPYAPENPTGQKSGLSFDGFSPPLHVAIDQAFDLGTLTHENYSVKAGTAASGARLQFDFDIKGAHPVHQSHMFDLTIDETNNEVPISQCKYNSTTYACADKISFPQMQGAQSFTLDGVNYTLSLLGFGDSPDNLMHDFITQERASSSTDLWGVISAVPMAVPEPGILGMFGLGLLGIGGLAVAARRREAHASETNRS